MLSVAMLCDASAAAAAGCATAPLSVCACCCCCLARFLAALRSAFAAAARASSSASIVFVALAACAALAELNLSRRAVLGCLCVPGVAASRPQAARQRRRGAAVGEGREGLECRASHCARRLPLCCAYSVRRRAPCFVPPPPLALFHPIPEAKRAEFALHALSRPCACFADDVRWSQPAFASLPLCPPRLSEPRIGVRRHTQAH